MISLKRENNTANISTVILRVVWPSVLRRYSEERVVYKKFTTETVVESRLSSTLKKSRKNLLTMKQK